ncbi:NUDIX hydrolase [Paracoccus spongiarum]|uniref:NUDIX hydrolase n=1 Tax=Paracoccus spongiarum TaxID=3064387 RepID=A0ABT9J8G6_9RHOB|nr:NUDIX hydrolase [Paracoccus sp. 2205BS29-5]MDP5305925.1 NUDIX hydrolase [Paracoccus sp. 2205BS29-5]
MHDIPDADAYGAVIFCARVWVLPRESADHFGGCVWTFPKGKPRAGESPAGTAAGSALDKTGYRVDLLDVIRGVFAGTASSSASVLAGARGKQRQTTLETASTRWVRVEEVKEHIAQTRVREGRERDLANLRAAGDLHAHMPWDRRPARRTETQGPCRASGRPSGGR